MNLFKRFESLVRRPLLRVATVTAANGSGWFVQESDGSITAAIGQAQIGQKVYVREKHIEGPAPDLPLNIIEE